MNTRNHDAIQISSGNVFGDLGLENSDELQEKAELARQIAEVINAKQLNPEQICQALNISSDWLCDLTRGKLRESSLVQLLDFVSVLQNL